MTKKQARPAINHPLPPGGTFVYGMVSRDLAGFAFVDDSRTAELIAAHLADHILNAHSIGFILPGNDTPNLGEF